MSTSIYSQKGKAMKNFLNGGIPIFDRVSKIEKGVQNIIAQLNKELYEPNSKIFTQFSLIFISTKFEFFIEVETSWPNSDSQYIYSNNFPESLNSLVFSYNHISEFNKEGCLTTAQMHTLEDSMAYIQGYREELACLKNIYVSLNKYIQLYANEIEIN